MTFPRCWLTSSSGCLDDGSRKHLWNINQLILKLHDATSQKSVTDRDATTRNWNHTKIQPVLDILVVRLKMNYIPEKYFLFMRICHQCFQVYIPGRITTHGTMAHRVRKCTGIYTWNMEIYDGWMTPWLRQWGSYHSPLKGKPTMFIRPITTSASNLQKYQHV